MTVHKPYIADEFKFDQYIFILYNGFKYTFWRLLTKHIYVGVYNLAFADSRALILNGEILRMTGFPDPLDPPLSRN